MASLLPLISEILPMIMPSSTRITRAKQLEPAHPTVEGPVIQREAIVNKCDKMCALGEKAHSHRLVFSSSSSDLMLTVTHSAHHSAQLCLHHSSQ